VSKTSLALLFATQQPPQTLYCKKIGESHTLRHSKSHTLCRISKKAPYFTLPPPISNLQPEKAFKFTTLFSVKTRSFRRRNNITAHPITSRLNWQTTSNITRSSTNQDNDQRLITSTDDSQFTWLWWWLPLRLSKRQSMSPRTVLLRTTLTRTITIYRIKALFVAFHNVIRKLAAGCEIRGPCTNLVNKVTESQENTFYFKLKIKVFVLPVCWMFGIN